VRHRRETTWVLLMMAAARIVILAGQGDQYGPEVRSFLELIRHEEQELEFQIRHDEISRKDYVRSRDQLQIHRQKVLELVRLSGEDEVPELHVLPASRVEQLIEGGMAVLKNVKQGDVIRDKWKYLGQVKRSEIFYIFERITPR
jgi:hypothetical protein